MNKPAIAYGEMDSPIGTLLLATTQTGICTIQFGTFRDAEQELRRWSERYLPGSGWIKERGSVEQAMSQLDEYFAGRRKTFELPLDLYGTPFQMKVWSELCRIGFGQTASYKDIAGRIGSEKAVRAIGGANNRNPVSIVVPCHRVIGADGSMVGYGGGLSIKTFLLDLEGRS